MKESRTLECKETVTNSFLKTVSAYANYGRGQIVFGIDDDGKASGISDIEAARLSIENRINDSISPMPSYTLETDEKNGVIILTVEEGLHKPYLYHAKAYCRHNTATVEVDRIELGRLILEGQNLSYEELPSQKRDLTFECLGRKLDEVQGTHGITSDILRTFGLEDAEGTYNVAAELLADANGYPGIDAVRFGETINIFLDRRTFEHESVLKEYDDALEMFRTYYTYEEIVGAQRVARECIPEAAFREALANALVHRQWDVPQHVRISMFGDRVEIVSPGGLPRGITEQEYISGQASILRNPILGNVFFRLHIIERFGTGVARIRDAYRQSLREPDFAVFENSIKVTLPVLVESLAQNLSEDARRVCQLLAGRRMAISEIASATGFSRSKLRGMLKALEEQGLISVQGTGRGTRYVGKA